MSFHGSRLREICNGERSSSSTSERAISFPISHHHVFHPRDVSFTHFTAILSGLSFVRLLQNELRSPDATFLRVKIVANSPGRLFPVFPRADGTELVSIADPSPYTFVCVHVYVYNVYRRTVLADNTATDDHRFAVRVLITYVHALRTLNTVSTHIYNTLDGKMIIFAYI